MKLINTWIELKVKEMWGEVIDSIHYFKQTSILNRCVQLRNANYWHLCDRTSDLAANIDCTRTQGQMIVNAHLFMSLILSNKSSTIMRHECSFIQSFSFTSGIPVHIDWLDEGTRFVTLCALPCSLNTFSAIYIHFASLSSSSFSFLFWKNCFFRSMTREKWAKRKGGYGNLNI